MPTLNNRVRDELNKLISEELEMVDTRAKIVADKYWKEAEKEVAESLGYGNALTQIEHIKNQIEGLQTELAKLEGSLTERSYPATALDYQNCGLEVTLDRYGRPYNKPFVFGRAIDSSWDTKILKHLNDKLSFFKVYSNLRQLQHSVRRELLLAGTFEDARMVYLKFHNKVTEALGDQMPKLLSEVNSIPSLNPEKER